MADRIALSIEPDNGTADQIQQIARAARLQGSEHPERRRRNGVGPNEQAVRHHPERRAAQGRLRDLATSCGAAPACARCRWCMISSEETLATFEQHKKLKSRADEYLLKPLEESVFVAKVAGLTPAGDGRRRRSRAGRRFRHRAGGRRRHRIVSSRRRRRGADSVDEHRQRARGRHLRAEADRIRRYARAVRRGEVRSRDAGGVRRAGGGVARAVVADQRHGRSAQPVVGRRSAAESWLGGGPREQGRRQGWSRPRASTTIPTATAPARRWVRS